jgi:tetratricopeptide (TPR) repeat protein
MSKQLDRAFLLIDLSRYDQAAKELKKALEIDPNDSLNYMFLGVCLLREKNYKEAEIELRKSIELNPECSDSYQFLALQYLEETLPSQAKNNINIAIKLNPSNPFYFSILSKIFILEFNYNSALNAANDGLENDPRNIMCLQSKAISLALLNEYTMASRVIKLALAEDPEDADSQSIYGCILLEKKRFRLALSYLQESIRIDPDNELANEVISVAIERQHILYRIFSVLQLDSQNIPLIATGVLFLSASIFSINHAFEILVRITQIIILQILLRNLTYVYVLQPLIRASSLSESPKDDLWISRQQPGNSSKGIVIILVGMLFYFVFLVFLTLKIDINVMLITVNSICVAGLVSERFSNQSQATLISLFLLVVTGICVFSASGPISFIEGQRFCLAGILGLIIYEAFKSRLNLKKYLRILAAIFIGGLHYFLMPLFSGLMQNISDTTAETQYSFSGVSEENSKESQEETDRSNAVLNTTQLLLESLSPDSKCEMYKTNGLLDNPSYKKVFSKTSKEQIQRFSKAIQLRCINTPTSLAQSNKEMQALKLQLDRIDKKLYKSMREIYEKLGKPKKI